MLKLFVPLIILIGLLSLAGCGGGGGSKAPTVYQASAVGVIMQSKSFEGASFRQGALNGSRDSSLKKLDLVAGGLRTQATGAIGSTAAAPPAFLSANISYVYLTWDRIPNATRYQIVYNGTTVWDSNAVSANDPAFSLTNPQAYLDLDGELTMINSAGTYQFQINALNGGTTVHQFATVTASLGMVLANFPTDIAYTSGTKQLAWTGVTGASGYRVRIYSDSTYTTGIYDSGTTLLSATGANLAAMSLTTGTLYGVIVDAVAVDSSGKTLEITRGIGGFTF